MSYSCNAIAQAEAEDDPLALEKEMKFFCFCGRGFKEYHALNGHKRIHKGCAPCKLVTKNFGEYAYHMASVHPARYRCKICGYEDKSPNDVMGHIINHARFASLKQELTTFFEPVDRVRKGQ